MPSQILGNAFEESLSEIYDSDLARRYRAGTDACKSCTIRHSCGGCLAIAYSHGLDIFNEQDPFCFIEDVDDSNNRDLEDSGALTSEAGT